MKTSTYFWSYLGQFLLKWEIFRTKVLEKIKTQFMFNNFFFFEKSCRLWDNVEKYCRAEQATGDNTAHSHCVLSIYGYKHPLKVQDEV